MLSPIHSFNNLQGIKKGEKQKNKQTRDPINSAFATFSLNSPPGSGSSHDANLDIGIIRILWLDHSSYSFGSLRTIMETIRCHGTAFSEVWIWVRIQHQSQMLVWINYRSGYGSALRKVASYSHSKKAKTVKFLTIFQKQEKRELGNKYKMLRDYFREK